MPGLLSEVGDLKNAASKRYAARKKLASSPLSLSLSPQPDIAVGGHRRRTIKPTTGSSDTFWGLFMPTKKSAAAAKNSASSKRRYATRSLISSHDSQSRPKSKLQSPTPINNALFTIRRKLSVESVPPSRIPSFMDHFLDYQSPSVDYDSEEIMLEIAYRINLNRARQSLHYTSRRYPRSLGLRRRSWNDARVEDGSGYDASIITESEAEESAGITTRHPDSFERSTSKWMDSDLTV
ncbi:hypothetical protein Moror_13889 [Moniliophthora roreri MCA 2997]|uniref:Uncharacterized protein n=2 Tax=Moniliophthora roreri TaxID=221103 RepID=V2XN50_MONRO|nr:hypothetical protein Moror_13889 [Moniliophthora roreri MCA 2997]